MGPVWVAPKFVEATWRRPKLDLGGLSWFVLLEEQSDGLLRSGVLGIIAQQHKIGYMRGSSLAYLQ